MVSNIILETERLKLIPFIIDDLDLLYQTFTNAFVRKYLWDDEIINTKKAIDILQMNAQLFEISKWGLWKIIIADSNAYAGFAGLWIFLKKSNLSYIWVTTRQNRIRLATEASNAIINYAFDELKFDYLTASADMPNEKSLKVCQRLNTKLKKHLKCFVKSIVLSFINLPENYWLLPGIPLFPLTLLYPD